MEGFKLHLLDYLAFFSYILLLVGVGWFYGRKKSTSAEYFLAGRSLPWYVVGSSYIASNISIEHFVGMIGAAVLYGICVATPEWSTIIAFTFMIWIFIPFLFSSKVYTAPEFLEKRFNKEMRFIFAAITILANVFVFMAPVIYGGSLFLVKLFGVNKTLAPIYIGLATGVFAIWGGLKSVAFMDVVTIIFKIGGGLIVTILGLIWLGDHYGEGGIIEGLRVMINTNLAKDGLAKQWVENNISHFLNGNTSNQVYHRMSVIQPINQETNPWTHWVFSFFYIGLWYTAFNQHLIQKVFAAKDMYHARMGIVFASFLKLLVPLVVVFPGLIYFAIEVNNPSSFLHTQSWEYMNDEVNNTYIVMVRDYVPVFLVGILMAAFFGAIQSTISSVINSTSTIFTMDFYQNFFNKNPSEKQIVKVGQITGIIILILAIAFAIVLGSVKTNLFVFIQASYTFIGPPFSAIFLLGMLWKKVSGKDALLTLAASFCLSLFLKYLEFGSLANSESEIAGIIKPFGNQGLITWIFAMVVCSISAIFTPNPLSEQVGEGLVFNIDDKTVLKAGLGTKWYNSVTFWWALAFGIMLAIIFYFSVVMSK
jgi:solute:Na+ symporter, SSS family